MSIVMKLLFSFYTKCDLYPYFLESPSNIMLVWDIYQVLNHYFNDNLNEYVL